MLIRALCLIRFNCGSVACENNTNFRVIMIAIMMEVEETKRHAQKLKVEFTKESLILRRGSAHSKSSQATFNKEISILVTDRKTRKLIDNGFNVVPKLLEFVGMGETFQNLVGKANVLLGVEQERAKQLALTKTEEVSVKHSYTTMNVTMDDIATQMSISIQSSTDIPILRPLTESEEDMVETHKMPSYIKIILQETEDILLFEKGSVTVEKDSEEAEVVVEDNKVYDFLTTGKGKNRRRMDAETQTVEILYKTRHANTERIRKLEIGTFVSNYDMFDTYEDLETVVTKVESERDVNMEVTTYKHRGLDEFNTLKNNPHFQLAVMLTQRLLAGNVFHEEQKRFRNMYLPDPLSLDVKYHYTMKELWIFKTIDAAGKAVSSFDWCPTNSDLLVAAYGVFNYLPHEDRRFGIVCVWSIKNPVNPERKYRYPYPVTSVAFSRKSPQLIAVGLYNGEVQVLDITETTLETALVAVSQRSTSPGTEPITEIKWIDVHSADGADREQLLTSSEDGTIMKYSLTSGLFLVGFQQMKLDRVEGQVEGIRVTRKKDLIEADRHPQGLMIKIHPEKSDTYFVGTDEGSIHKCSTNYPHQHTDIIQIHNGSVFTLEYSPWSPKILLSCGSDWCIRVWIESIFEPIIHLSSGIGPVHSACWSPIHSTIIIGTTRNAVEIWDIRRNILKPVATRTFGAGTVFLTTSKFSTCGRSVVVGDEEGVIHVCALEDMPFPPHFQFKELESAIFKALVANPELTRQVESLGFLGYPNGSRRLNL